MGDLDPQTTQELGVSAYLEPAIERECLRIHSQFSAPGRLLTADAGACLTVADVLRAHFVIANHFLLEGQGLGGVGPRDNALLESAVYRQIVSLGGMPKWRDKFEICATLFFGLIMSHPFHDANKRTAFLSLLYQLEKQGWCPAVDQQVFEDFTVDIADHRLRDHSKYAEYRTKYPEDHDVKFISYWIRRHIRKIEHKAPSISFRELEAVLNRYGYSLENPHGNQIDVVQIRGQYADEPDSSAKDSKVGRIGFPSWSKQVLKSDIKLVRELTSLTAEAGVDAAAFFDGLDPMQALIATYHEPLTHLANR